MTAVKLPQISFQEYLKIEEASETRHEFYYGEMFDMAGGTNRHNQIVGNIYYSLRTKLAHRDCIIRFETIRVEIEENNYYTYPDVVVSCNKHENKKFALQFPVVIFEVLSDSTSDYDRVEKFRAYQNIPSFECYILVDQKRCAIECFTKIDGKWIYKSYLKVDNILEISTLNISIPLSEIYEAVTFDALFFKETLTK